MVENKEESLLPKNRIEALCDAIFAIAMTLIILDLKTPENIPSNIIEEELPKILVDLIPEMEAYAISFIILAIFWLRHLFHFKYLENVNRRIITLNIIFLMFIGFIPFSVGFMMRYNSHHLPFVVYIVNLLILSIILFYHWRYISGRDKNYFKTETDTTYFEKYRIISSIPVIIFSISLIVSFFNLRLAFLIIYLDPVLYIFYRYIVKTFFLKPVKNVE